MADDEVDPVVATLDIEQDVRDYVECRDILKLLEMAYDKKKAPLQQKMDEISGRIQLFMDNNKIKKGLRTDAGTCYRSTRYTATVADAEAFMNFVKDGHWDMIERRANSTAVKDYVHEHNELPPGCNLNAMQTLGVRRASGKRAK